MAGRFITDGTAKRIAEMSDELRHMRRRKRTRRRDRPKAVSKSSVENVLPEIDGYDGDTCQVLVNCGGEYMWIPYTGGITLTPNIPVTNATCPTRPGIVAHYRMEENSGETSAAPPVNGVDPSDMTLLRQGGMQTGMFLEEGRFGRRVGNGASVLDGLLVTPADITQQVFAPEFQCLSVGFWLQIDSNSAVTENRVAVGQYNSTSADVIDGWDWCVEVEQFGAAANKTVRFIYDDSGGTERTVSMSSGTIEPDSTEPWHYFAFYLSQSSGTLTWKLRVYKGSDGTLVDNQTGTESTNVLPSWVGLSTTGRAFGYFDHENNVSNPANANHIDELSVWWGEISNSQ